MNFLIRLLILSSALAPILHPMPAFAAEEGAEALWIVSVFTRGGPVMWPILFCSILAVAISLERLFSLRRSRIINKAFLEDAKKIAVKGEFEKALKFLSTNDHPMSRIFQAGLMRGRFGVLEVERAIEAAGAHEATSLESNLRGLGVVANLAPMLGLLGTVTGMINAFNVISQAGTGNPGLVAAGIAEALITTAAGLIIGIPTLALYHYFRGKVDKLIHEMEEVSLAFVEDIMHTVDAVSRRSAERAPLEDEVQT